MNAVVVADRLGQNGVMTRSAARLFSVSTALVTTLVALAACDAYTPAKQGDVVSQLGKPATASITAPAQPSDASQVQAANADANPAGCAPGTSVPTGEGTSPVIPGGCEAAYRQGLADGARAAREDGANNSSETSATESLYRQGVRRVESRSVRSPHYRAVSHRSVTYGASAHSVRTGTGSSTSHGRVRHAEVTAYASGDTSSYEAGHGQGPAYAGPGSINEGVYVGPRAGARDPGGSLYGSPYGYGAHPSVQAPTGQGVVVQRRDGEETRYGQAYQYPNGSYNTHGGYGQNGHSSAVPNAPRPAPVASATPVRGAAGPVGTYATGGYYAPQGQVRVCQCQAAGAMQPGAVWASAGRDAGGYLTFAGKPRH